MRVKFVLKLDCHIERKSIVMILPYNKTDGNIELRKLFIIKANLIEEINVNFLKTVHGAELVEFVMDFVEDQRLVVVGRVVADDVVD